LSAAAKAQPPSKASAPPSIRLNRRRADDMTAAAGDASGRRGAGGTPRSFLFLQGPISSFFDRLGRALIARGHRVHRVNLHLGDRLFWHLPGENFRGRFADWRQFIGGLLDRHAVTDLMLHGDRRPYHLVAAEEARARGIAVIATDLGYLRPDWLTLEYDGMTTYSRFPRDPQRICELAAEFPEPDLAPRFHTPFWLIASRDILYNLAMVFGRPLYPHYRYHSTCHPFLEYAGWARSRPLKLLAARTTAAAKRRLAQQPASYFLVPLQLQTDFSIRAHSPYRDLRDAARAIVASFAASGSEKRLVFVIHPLDNGLIRWHRLIARLAASAGVADRVVTLHGGTPIDLQRSAAGIVTVNSTAALTALRLGVPTKVLGNAVFDIAGLTCQSPLDAFWRKAPPPDPELTAAFVRALVGTTQVQGGYYERRAQDCAIAGFVERLEQGLYPLPPLGAAELAARAPRPIGRTIAVTGVADPIGVALARSLAAPGVRLCLFGSADLAAQTATDCRQRGAVVETVAAADGAAPVDVLVAQAPRRASSGFSDALDAVSRIAEAMRRRGTGRIVLVGSPPGPTTGVAAGAPGSGDAWLGDAAALRRRLCGSAVSLAVATPSRFSLRLAASPGEPQIVAAGPDLVAERVAAGLRRGRRRIAVPDTATVIVRTLRLAPSRARRAIRAGLLPRPPAIGRRIDAPPLAGELAPGARQDLSAFDPA
jgi:capsular polysaccharide export protein